MNFHPNDSLERIEDDGRRWAGDGFCCLQDCMSCFGLILTFACALWGMAVLLLLRG
jgi:hypothetical protein